MTSDIETNWSRIWLPAMSEKMERFYLQMKKPPCQAASPADSRRLIGGGLHFWRSVVRVTVVAVAGVTVAAGVGVRAGAGAAGATLAVVSAVEARALEDNGGQADLAPGFLAAGRAGVLRWGVEALGQLVLVSGAALVVVKGQRYHPPDWVGKGGPSRAALLTNIANAKGVDKHLAEHPPR